VNNVRVSQVLFAVDVGWEIVIRAGARPACGATFTAESPAATYQRFPEQFELAGCAENDIVTGYHRELTTGGTM
jgi:hypothetical protein